MTSFFSDARVPSKGGFCNTSANHSNTPFMQLSKVDVVDRILSVRRDLDAEAVVNLVEEKKRQVGPLLTDEVAAYLVSQDLGVEVIEQPGDRLGLPIAGLVSKLNDVSIDGRIIVVHPPRSFSREDGSQGEVLKMVLADGTGLVRVLAWNGKVAEFREKALIEGRDIRVLHGYTKEDPDGRTELHLGERAVIEPLSDAIRAAGFPRTDSLLRKLAQLESPGGDVWTEATVALAGPASEYEREEGKGRARRLVLEDETGRVTLVLWNDEVDDLGSVQQGWRVKVLSGVLRRGVNGEPEIHLGRWGRAAVVSQATHPGARRAKIAELDGLSAGAHLTAIVVAIARLKESTSFDGRTGRSLSLLIGDETGMARLTLWDDAVRDALSFTEGDMVSLEVSSARKRFGDVELHIREPGHLSKARSNSGETASWSDKHTPLQELAGAQGYVTVEGLVDEAPETRRVATSGGREALVASFSIVEGSTKVRVSAWDSFAEEATRLTPGRRLRLRHARVLKRGGGQAELSTSVFSKLENGCNEPT